MTTKHTPHFDFDEGDGSLYEFDQDGNPIALFSADPECPLETFEEFKKRAAFIVKACNSFYERENTMMEQAYEIKALNEIKNELLDALKALDKFWTSDFPEGPEAHEGLLSKDTLSIWRSARAAIAKAEAA